MNLNVNLFQVLLSCLSIVVVAMVIPELRKARTAKEWGETVEKVRIAVKAAEQIIGPGKGADKYDLAVTTAKRLGVKVDAATLRPLIESAVKELNLWAEKRTEE